MQQRMADLMALKSEYSRLLQIWKQLGCYS